MDSQVVYIPANLEVHKVGIVQARKIEVKEQVLEIPKPVLIEAAHAAPTRRAEGVTFTPPAIPVARSIRRD
jgi:hypothetical protein